MSNYGRGMSEEKAENGVPDLGRKIQEEERHFTSCDVVHGRLCWGLRSGNRGLVKIEDSALFLMNYAAMIYGL